MSFWNKLIVRITGDSADLDRTLDKSEGKIGSWAKKTSLFIRGALSIGAIITFSKAVIGASEDLSDKFSFAVAGAKGALREFFSTLATGDFSNFFANLKEGYTKAKELAEAMDLFQDKKAYTEYVLSGKKREAASYEEVVKDKTGKYSLEKRQEYAAKLKAIEEEIKKITADTAKEIFDLEAQAWENRNKMTVEEAKKLYETVATISKENIETLDKTYEKQIRAHGKESFLNNRIYTGENVFIPLSKEYKKYYDLQLKGETELIPKLFKAYQTYEETVTAAQERFNGVLRITNQLLEEQTAIVQTATPRGSAGSKLQGKGTQGMVTTSTGLYPMQFAEPDYSAIESFNEFNKAFDDVMRESVSIASQGIENLFEAMGSGDWSSFGEAMLTGIAGFLSMLGKMLIAFALAEAGFMKALMNPLAWPVAMAAGIAAMAIAGLIKGAIKSQSQSFSGGGSSSSSSYSGGGGGGGGASGEIALGGQFTIRGKDLIKSIRRNR